MKFLNIIYVICIRITGWRTYAHAFSLKNTIGDLMKIPHTSAPGQLACLHGLRVGSILWVILGHTYMFHSSWPLVNYLSGSYSASLLAPVWIRKKWKFLVDRSAILRSTYFKWICRGGHFFPAEWTFDRLRALNGRQKRQEIQHC